MNYIGQILIGAWPFAPVGTLECKGQLLDIASYPSLYSIIGTTYGGDGINTFKLPDLQGRVAVGEGGSYVYGSTGGAESQVLTVDNLPQHNHTAHLLSAPASSPTGNPSGNALAAETRSSADIPNIYSNDGLTPSIELSTGSVVTDTAGGGQPFSIVPAYQVLSFVIVVNGAFPQMP